MLSRKAKLIKRTSGLSKGTLLDIGTGTGYFSNAMKERGWRVKAIEKSPQARSFAKEHFELDVDTEDALAGYADHSFDAITLWHVMEHLEHLNETWEKLFKLLKERGVLIVAVPNPSSYERNGGRHTMCPVIYGILHLPSCNNSVSSMVLN